MTQDEIINMARECFADPDGSLVLLTPELTAFAKLVAQHEREACAKLAYEILDEHEGYDFGVADAIRARGQA